MASGQATLTDVDWSSLPVPDDDGAASHLSGCPLPDIPLPATDGTEVSLARLSRAEPSRPVVVYAYPMTGRPDVPLPEGWDEIPGARGCTPQSCAFGDHHADLLAAGAAASSASPPRTPPTSARRPPASTCHSRFFRMRRCASRPRYVFLSCLSRAGHC